ncbi:UPF0528 protein CG10038 isoform X2 [Harpegnathos saltator]|uniref:UPF0528 protein CG10038 isoform X2 n=1 Tax=Harpegnathos saltator TaxID=610380 RepID=UPI00058EED6C|nr:UPF0528 protein CG10038 isoform X2 [Harpegnathos saltator]
MIILAPSMPQIPCVDGGKVSLFAKNKRHLPKTARTLDELGYIFKNGKLKHVGIFKDVMFNTEKENIINDLAKELRYEVYNALDEYVYKLLEKEGLKKLPVPKKSSDLTLEKSFIYASTDSFTNDKLIIIVNGCGAVVGQWSRQTIINYGLDYGTQISYVDKAKKLGYGILLLNINDNLRIIDGKLELIQGSIDGYQHFKTVWKNYIQDCQAKNIAIIAHNFGGDCVIRNGMILEEHFKKRVFAVALIDSPLNVCCESSILKTICKFWTFKNIKIDNGNVEYIISDDNDRRKLPFLCMKPIFNYIQRKYFRVKDISRKSVMMVYSDNETSSHVKIK